MADRDRSQLLETIRGLLAKAESSEYAAEAESFTAKAQELMASHSVEMAMLDRATRAADGAEPTSRRVKIDRPYTVPKLRLLGTVADANHCRVIWVRADEIAVVFGFEHDLVGSEMLYTSLLVQATRAMTDAGPRTDGRGRNRTRSFRRSFLLGFADRIGWRLREAANTSTTAATKSFGAAVVPVMAERDRRVESTMHDAYPAAGAMGRVEASNLSGWFAGEDAAERADLGDQSPLASQGGPTPLSSQPARAG